MSWREFCTEVKFFIFNCHRRLWDCHHLPLSSHCILLCIYLLTMSWRSFCTEVTHDDFSMAIADFGRPSNYQLLLSLYFFVFCCLVLLNEVYYCDLPIFS